MVKFEPEYLDITKREFEVLGLVVKGYSNHEIAGILRIRENTSKAHVNSLIAKTTAINRIHRCYISAKEGFKP